MPGRVGAYAADFSQIVEWSPTLVISMVDAAEFVAKDTTSFGNDLAALGMQWHHIPVPDFGVPAGLNWSDLCTGVLARLRSGERVLIHCMGGCGRSGMIALRLMIAAGEPAEEALFRLRQARLCAVETDAQMTWAAQDVGPS
ncbi:MAG: protein-tyrosine phosphatase [Yoonia sp.]|jgi:protein-tyrosine phosphatase